MTVQIRIGDCRQVLRSMPAESVHCCVTSPPYYGLRDYGVEGQMGLEPDPQAFVHGMVAVFREVRRVLRKDGTLWLNIGDSYAGSGRGGNPTSDTSTLDGGQASQEQSMVKRSRDDVSDNQRANCARVRGSRLPAGMHESQRQAGAIGRAWVPPPLGLKNKDLIGIPWMLAFALRADGWYLRQDIIWSKPNPMPESCKDRCTKSHEYLFLLSRSARYHCDMDAIKELASTADEYMHAGTASGLHSGESHEGSGKSTRRYSKGIAGWASGQGDHDTADHNQAGRSTHAAKVKNGKGDRATFRGGGAYTHEQAFDNDGEIQNDSVGNKERLTVTRNKRSVWNVATHPFKEAHFATFPPALIVDCIKAGCPRGGTVLDPFFGAGTTGLVADREGRDCIGIELNPKYADMAHKRINTEGKLFAAATLHAASGSSASSGMTTDTVASSSTAGSPCTSTNSAP